MGSFLSAGHPHPPTRAVKGIKNIFWNLDPGNIVSKQERKAKSTSRETKKRLNTHEEVWGRTCLRRDHEAEH